MATSGSIDYSVSASDIITEALEQLGVLSEGQSANSDQITSCLRTLNMLVKTWQADGLNLHTVQKLYLVPQKAQTEYSLGPSGDHFTTTLVNTAVKVAGVATDTTIDVDYITGISDGDYIGIELDTGYLHWTTVNGAPAGDTVTLTDALPSAVAIDNTVYAYTTKGNRPMDILNAVRSTTDGTDTPLWIKNRKDYTELTPKSSQGVINQLWYDRQVTTGKLTVWQAPTDVDSYITMWVQRTIEDFDSSADDADYPQEWYLPLAFNLATLLIPKYGVPPNMIVVIQKMAIYYYDMARSWDVEESVQFSPSDEAT
jgi:hypothetical protein